MNQDKIKEDFPIFESSELSYLDNAATSQKPKQVINRIKEFYMRKKTRM